MSSFLVSYGRPNRFSRFYSRIVQIIKSITAKKIFTEVKKMLWGGQFWTSGFYLNTVGQYGNEKVIKEYVKAQGKNYKQIHRGQLKLFEDFA